MNNKLTDITNPSLGPLGATLHTGAGQTFIARLVSVMITGLLIAGSVVFLFSFLMGAISWMTSGGDAKKTEAARAKVTQAAIGLAIMFSAWAVLTLIEDLFNVSLINIDLNVLKINMPIS